MADAPGAGRCVVIQLVPARHWCRRRLGGSNLRLWGGFVRPLGRPAALFCGRYSATRPDLFKEIRRRCGPPDLALLPIGAYEPRWFMKESHMNPAEAVRAHREVGARRSLGMHWGTFQLTDEARGRLWVEALRRRRAARRPWSEEFNVLPHWRNDLVAVGRPCGSDPGGTSWNSRLSQFSSPRRHIRPCPSWAKTLIIAGGGIGGMAAGLALHRAGLRGQGLRTGAGFWRNRGGNEPLAQCHPGAPVPGRAGGGVGGR